ncbi:MAG: hypothetical protein ACI82Z_000722 [Cellvibrionaceae bacterium]|jgi:hypothetical protein
MMVINVKLNPSKIGVGNSFYGTGKNIQIFFWKCMKVWKFFSITIRHPSFFETFRQKYKETSFTLRFCDEGRKAPMWDNKRTRGQR